MEAILLDKLFKALDIIIEPAIIKIARIITAHKVNLLFSIRVFLSLFFKRG